MNDSFEFLVEDPPESPTWKRGFNPNILFTKNVCCIQGCGINAKLRNFKCLVGNWKLKRGCLKNSKQLKICSFHYKTDLKRYPRSVKKDESVYKRNGKSLIEILLRASVAIEDDDLMKFYQKKKEKKN